MVKATSKVSGSGVNHIGLKTVIPKDIATKLNLKIGDILLWEIPNGYIKVRKL